MKKYYKFVLLSIAFFILSLFIVNPTVNAEDTKKTLDCGGKCSFYYNTLTKDEFDKMYSLSIDDLTENGVDSVLDWVNSESTAVLIQKFGNGHKYIWWNVPNTPQWIKTQVYQIFPTGYIGDGITANADAKTAVQKWGWSLPKTTYLGETPYIDMDMVSVIVPDNPVGWIKRFFKWLFKGDVLDAPDANDLLTLHYSNVSDYFDDPNSLKGWIENNWKTVLTAKTPDGKKGKNDSDLLINPGQCLYAGASKKSKCNINGKVYVRQTVIEDLDLDNFTKYPPSQPEKIINKLQSALGEDFEQVIVGLIKLAEQEEKKGNLTLVRAESYARVMPYDITTMQSKDKTAIKIPDPRVEFQKRGSLPGIVGFFDDLIGATRQIAVKISNVLISIGGFFAKLSSIIASACNFDWLEKAGLSPVDIWKTPIIKFLISIIVIITVIKLAIGAVNLARGKAALLAICTDFFLMFLIIGIFTAINLNVDKTYNSVKHVIGMVFDWGESSMSLNDDLKPFYGNETNMAELRDTTYWLPYFSLWTEYNVGYTLLDDENKINPKSSNEPEQVRRNDGWNLERINSKSPEIPYWSATLLGGLDNGPTIDRSVYRVVDHFMAPRVKYLVNDKSDSDSSPMISVSANENYNGKYQKSVNIGTILIIILIFFCTLYKFLLTINAWFEIYTFVANCAMAAITPRAIGEHAKRMGFSILAVGLWGLYISIIIFLTLLLSGVGTIIIAILLWWATFQIIKTWLIKGGDTIRPRLFSVFLDKIM